MRLTQFSILMILFFLPIYSSHGQNKGPEGILNKLLSPGPLIHGHKDLEVVDCLKCHIAGKGISDEKCLDCHKEIRKSIKKKNTFHGLKKKSCFECHADHKGREFDSTLINEKTFDHSDTGFELGGKHEDIKCQDCHTEKREKKDLRKSGIRFFGQTSLCVDCHKKDDSHKFTGDWQKKDCGECHSDVKWKDVEKDKFNHDIDTKYKLVGEHENIDCNKCHVTENRKFGLYKWPNLKKDQCLACHEDFHKNKLSPQFQGGDCNKCHNQNEWKITPFDHKVTGYELKGAHSDLECLKCHDTEKAKLKVANKELDYTNTPKECIGCHKDYHGFNSQIGKGKDSLQKCQNCHGEKKWDEELRFDHDKDTKFPVDGKHFDLKCFQCHIPTDTTLKLLPESQKTGPSKYVATKEISRIYHFKEMDIKTCETCHQSPHEKSFAVEYKHKKCTECHITKGWKEFGKTTRFDHDQTRFKLDGAHLQTSCVDCHSVDNKQKFQFPSYEKKFCVDCHKTVHTEQFHDKFNNQSCAQCHKTTDFREDMRFDHEQANFHIKGKHKDLKCYECHKKTNIPFPKPSKNLQHQFLFPQLEKSDCATCHKDVHKGDYGNKCSKCHTEEDWKKSPDFHKNFTLNGIHFALQCQECHVGNRALGGMSQNCRLCHQKDDVHSGSLPDCGTCHRQSFWEQTSFRHALTNFPLRGSHRALECSACHATGLYQGVAADCISCHLDNAQSVSSPPHIMPQFSDCKNCHNQFVFQ